MPHASCRSCSHENTRSEKTAPAIPPADHRADAALYRHHHFSTVLVRLMAGRSCRHTRKCSCLGPPSWLALFHALVAGMHRLAVDFVFSGFRFAGQCVALEGRLEFHRGVSVCRLLRGSEFMAQNSSRSLTMRFNEPLRATGSARHFRPCLALRRR